MDAHEQQRATLGQGIALDVHPPVEVSAPAHQSLITVVVVHQHAQPRAPRECLRIGSKTQPMGVASRSLDLTAIPEGQRSQPMQNAQRERPRQQGASARDEIQLQQQPQTAAQSCDQLRHG